MKRKMALALSALMMVSMAACGTDGGDGASTGSSASTGNSSTSAESSSESGGSGDLSGVTLEIAHNLTGGNSEVFSGLIDKFVEETGCKVDISEYGNDYESTMKTRMASNELPDVFVTHGWSILRYKEYLMDLSDQPWATDYDEGALGVIEDEGGEIYVMMTSAISNGTLVNFEVCEDAGVDPYAIKTWDDFTEACQKIKDAGYVPIGNVSNPGMLANIGGTYTSYEGELAQDSEAMLDGTWDWESFRAELKMYQDWIEKGFFYDDVMTMNDTDLTQRWAENKTAFQVGNGPGFLVSAMELNPDGNYGLLPSFASADGGKMYIGTGEGEAFGIWKDSKNVDAAKQLLEFLSQPENAVTLSGSTGNTVCMKSAMSQDQSYGLEVYQTMQSKYAEGEVFYENLWDRQYMPSGMWPIFGNAMNMLFDDSSDAGIDAVIEYLQENYQDLYENAQAG